MTLAAGQTWSLRNRLVAGHRHTGFLDRGQACDFAIRYSQTLLCAEESQIARLTPLSVSV